jgi:phage terminase large subunit GpA-like protein
MCIQIANAEVLAMEAAARVFEPPPVVDYLEWAKDNIVFSERESPFPGPFNVERFPHVAPILAALSPEDPCRVVTLAGSAQIGKTVIANIFLGGSMAMDPCDFLVVHPTDDNASRWSKLKLSLMLKGTASLRGLFPEKSRDGSNSVLLKEHRDGLGAILISGANSPSSLSQVTMRRQVQDDLSKWDMNAAGDPESQADSRSRAHEFAKILKASTPLVLPGCRITKSFESGSQEFPTFRVRTATRCRCWNGRTCTRRSTRPSRKRRTSLASPAVARSRSIIAARCSSGWAVGFRHAFTSTR